MNPADNFENNFKPGSFKPWRLIFIVLAIMLFISYAIKWYSQSVTLPRFCKDPEMSLHHLEEIITKKTPTGNQYKQRKPYIIAAKLIYLVPQNSNESVDAYIHRVRIELSKRCVL
ncbi:MAG: hypothetical protein QM479_12850 [Pseudomonadota bacterium]